MLKCWGVWEKTLPSLVELADTCSRWGLWGLGIYYSGLQIVLRICTGADGTEPVFVHPSPMPGAPLFNPALCGFCRGWLRVPPRSGCITCVSPSLSPFSLDAFSLTNHMLHFRSCNRRCRAETAVAGRVCRHCKLEERFWQWEVGGMRWWGWQFNTAPTSVARSSPAHHLVWRWGIQCSVHNHTPAGRTCTSKWRAPLLNRLYRLPRLQGRAFALYSKAREGAGAVTADEAIRQAQQARRMW